METYKTLKLTDSTCHSNIDGVAKRVLGREDSPWEGYVARATPHLEGGVVGVLPLQHWGQ